MAFHSLKLLAPARRSNNRKQKTKMTIYFATTFSLLLSFGYALNVFGGIRTSSGTIQGHKAPNRPAVVEYLGIPFAKSPVGDLRFAAPQAYTGTGIFQASKFVGSSSLARHA